MIKGNFYPTVTTITGTGNKFTDTLINLNMPTASNAYWLGWVSEDNTSSVFNVSELEVTEDSYIFRRVNELENHNIGYVSQRDIASPNNTGLYNVFVYPTTPCTIKPAQNLAKYINQLDVKGSGNSVTTTSLLLDFAIGCKVDGESQGMTYFKTVGFAGIRAFLSAINGDTTVDIEWTINGTTLSKVISLPDLENDGYIHFDEYVNTTHVDVFITICSFMLGYSQADKDSSNTSHGISNILPVIDMHIGNDKYVVGIGGVQYRQIVPASGRYIQISTDYGFCSLNASTGQWIRPNWESANYYGSGKLVNGPECVIPKNIVSSPDGFFTFGNCLVWKRYVNQLDICRMYKPSDIYKLMGIQLRYQTSITGAGATIYSYVEDDGTNPKASWAPHVNDKNEFLAELITGNLTDDIFKSKLRLWQWDDTQWELNDYTEDKKPSYNPGDDSENVGDSVTLPSVFGVGTTNGFVTQYALRKSDIQQLGALLWTSFVDADYWRNYLFSLALDTGTFSLAGLMTFFVSLKVYPFPLVNVSGLVSEGGNDMYVGTGIVPLHFTNKLHSLTSYVDKIDGGYVRVWSSNFFGDWRDYVNTEITLYVPYCGTIHLNPADVVGNTVKIRYVIDFSTGGCVAYVMCVAPIGNTFMIGALPGQIGADVPLSATAAGEIAARFIGDAMNAGHLVGGEVGNIAGGIASGLSGNTPGAGGGNVLSGIAGVYGGLPAAMGADLAPGMASQALSMLTRSAVSAPLMSGGRGFASFGAPQIPYIQIRRGIYPKISKLSEISGKPSVGTYKVGDLSGFVSGVVKTDGINAHENEKAKIRRLIAGGIYV